MQKLIVAMIIMTPSVQAMALDCTHATTQSDMNQCANEEFIKADKELNYIYQQVLKSTSDKQKKLLQAAQRKWIGYRDSDCQFKTFKSREGSVWPMNFSTCLEDKTLTRAKELKNLLNCPEGDISCPL